MSIGPSYGSALARFLQNMVRKSLLCVSLFRCGTPFPCVKGHSTGAEVKDLFPPFRSASLGVEVLHAEPGAPRGSRPPNATPYVRNQAENGAVRQASTKCLW